MNFDAPFGLINFNDTTFGLETLAVCAETVLGAVVTASLAIKSSLQSAVRPLVGNFSTFPIVEFTELQYVLLKVFVCILAANIFLILLYWRKYGEIITDRFIRPSTLKEIEELKLSVAKLKLPKEHSPRI